MSKVLQGAETRYPYTEKVTLALVMAARKVRPYFQAHVVAVLTDQSLGQILQKPECSGRLTKWAIELSEYDLSFEPRKAIKRQAIVDFIMECTHTTTAEEIRKNEWMLFVDGASNTEGSGAGVLLISPEKEVLEYSLRFIFLSSNNVTEHEALLAGMKLAEKLEVSDLVALIVRAMGIRYCGPISNSIGTEEISVSGYGLLYKMD